MTQRGVTTTETLDTHNGVQLRRCRACRSQSYQVVRLTGTERGIIAFFADEGSAREVFRREARRQLARAG